MNFDSGPNKSEARCRFHPMAGIGTTKAVPGHDQGSPLTPHQMHPVSVDETFPKRHCDVSASASPFEGPSQRGKTSPNVLHPNDVHLRAQESIGNRCFLHVPSVDPVTLKALRNRYGSVTEPIPNRFGIRLGFEAAAYAHRDAWRRQR